MSTTVTFSIDYSDAHALRALVEDQAAAAKLNGVEEDVIFLNKMAKALTPEPIDPRLAAYLAENSTICPHCRSFHIQGSAVSIDGNLAQQNMSCNDCDAEWTDIYRLDRVVFSSQ